VVIETTNINRQKRTTVMTEAVTLAAAVGPMERFSFGAGATTY
jgi:hypothetical protein